MGLDDTFLQVMKELGDREEDLISKSQFLLVDVPGCKTNKKYLEFAAQVCNEMGVVIDRIERQEGKMAAGYMLRRDMVRKKYQDCPVFVSHATYKTVFEKREAEQKED